MKKIIITISEVYLLEGFDFWAELFKSYGLSDMNKLPDIGVITGSANEQTIEKIKKHQGYAVKSLEDDQEIQIAPPDSEIQ